MTVLQVRPDAVVTTPPHRPSRALVPAKIEVKVIQRTPTPLKPRPRLWHCAKLPDGFVAYRSTDEAETRARIKGHHARGLKTAYCTMPYDGD